MLLKYCLFHIDIMLPGHFLDLVYLLRRGVFLSYNLFGPIYFSLKLS